MAQPAFDPKSVDDRWAGPWTEADLERLPDNGQRYELIEGSLHVTPPPKEIHQSLEGVIWLLLRTAAPKGWRVRHEIGARLAKNPDTNMEPDVAVLVPDAPRDQVWNEARHMALVVEIESRSTKMYDRSAKPAVYAAAGIPSYWRVERPAKGGLVVHIYQLPDGEGSYKLVASVKPGETWEAEQPFRVLIDPDRIAAEAER